MTVNEFIGNLADSLDAQIAASWKESVASVFGNEHDPEWRDQILAYIKGQALRAREDLRQRTIAWMRNDCGVAAPDDCGLPCNEALVFALAPEAGAQ